MKIKAIVKIDDFENQYEISCGFGDKTFKWLAVVACQRFANAAPNGVLRSREGIRGHSEHVQHLPYELYLESGEVPHPSCSIADFAKDGDSVYIELLSRQKLEYVTGSPAQSKWSSLAFTHTTPLGDSGKVEEDDDVEVEGAEDEEALEFKIDAKANFMRIILKSQMLNAQYIAHQATSIWRSTVAVAMPNLKEIETIAIQAQFETNWDILVELFSRLCDGGSQMTAEQFQQFLEDSAAFPHRDCAALGIRVFRKTCQAAVRISGSSDSPPPTTLSFGTFLVALILTSQTSYHDTFVKSLQSLSGREAIEVLFSRNIRPLAEQLTLNSIVKETFCSRDFLQAVRNHNDKLVEAFQKYALKSHELPLSITADHMAEMLADAKLVTGGDVKASAALLRTVRTRGSVVGRAPDSDLPDNEYAYPEFVEASAITGYRKYFRSGKTGSTNDPGEAMLHGLSDAIETLKKPETTHKRGY